MKKLLSSILFLVVVFAPIQTHAAPLSSSQINSILTLLQVFGVDSVTLHNVSLALGNTADTTPVIKTESLPQVSVNVVQGAVETPPVVVVSNDVSIAPLAVENSQMSTMFTKFSVPYPIVWKDTNSTPNFGGSANFALTGVTLGEVVIDQDILTALWNGFNYQNYSKGQKVNALILDLKIDVEKGGMMPQSMRLITINNGDISKIAPPHRDYLYQNHKSMNDFVQSNTTIAGARIFFPVTPQQDEFIVSTGGQADIYFRIKKEFSNLAVTRLALSELSAFNKMFKGSSQGGLAATLWLTKDGVDLTGYIESGLIANNTVKLSGLLNNDGSFVLTVNEQSAKTLTGNLHSGDSVVLTYSETGKAPIQFNFKTQHNIFGYGY